MQRDQNQNLSLGGGPGSKGQVLIGKAETNRKISTMVLLRTWRETRFTHWRIPEEGT